MIGQFSKSLFPGWLLAFAFFCNMGMVKAADILVFAAASLTPPLQEIADKYGAATGDKIRISFAASSTLARQISRGAPAQIFISANEKWMDYVAARGFIEASSRRTVISNSLILVAPVKGHGGITSLTPESILSLLADRRMAIADPAHVPAGIYGAQALKSMGLWQSTKGKLAPMFNVRATLALVESGETPAGIVYASDAHNNGKVRPIYKFPATSHDPISYPAALVKEHKTEAGRNFFDQLSTPLNKSIFTRHGFLVK